jgi:cyclohexyl-isocyanide hydratase
MDRRFFTKLAAAVGAAKLLLLPSTARASVVEPTQESAAAQHQAVMDRYASLTDGSKLSIGMLLYPGMYLQDLVGPLTVFESLLNRDIHLLWKNTDPVGSDDPGQAALIPVRANTTFANCPERLDVLFVPGGGSGTLTMMEDPHVLAFLAEKGKTARFVTSVCTGSLILGAAGLLKGYKATSHWASRNVLKELGAIPTKGRIVIDRNRITGGGVTAGIDFGLKMVALLRSDDHARVVQLLLEYDPQPPFRSGSPETAPPLVRRFIDDMFVGFRDTARATARRARKLFLSHNTEVKP